MLANGKKHLDRCAGPELKVKRVIKDALDLNLKMEYRLFTSYVPFAHDNQRYSYLSKLFK